MATVVAPRVKGSLTEWLTSRGIGRRDFLKYCARLTAVLALPPRFTSQIAQALQSVSKPSPIWLEYQSCRGNSEAFLRARDPSVADLAAARLSGRAPSRVAAVGMVPFSLQTGYGLTPQARARLEVVVGAARRRLVAWLEEEVVANA